MQTMTNKQSEGARMMSGPAAMAEAMKPKMGSDEPPGMAECRSRLAAAVTGKVRTAKPAA